MSHEITTNAAGVAEAAFATPAWHGLGRTFDRAFTSAEAIEAAGLDWRVGKRPIFRIEVDDSIVRSVHYREIESHAETFREDTKEPLGIVGSNYGVLQNSEAFDALDALVPDGLLRYESAFSMNGGKKIVAVVRLAESLEIAPGDEVKPYAILTNAHDGSGAVNIFPTTVRIVCANTLRLARSMRPMTIKVTHTANVKDRTTQAVTILGEITKAFAEHGEKAKALARRRITDLEFEGFLNELMPVPPEKTESGRKSPKHDKALVARSRIRFNYADDPKQAVGGIRGTAWAALNALTQWVDHEAHFGARGDEASAFRAVTFGDAARLKDRAFETALELAGV